mgnify:CR=1 FL=1
MAAVSGGRLAQLREQAPRLLKKYRLPLLIFLAGLILAAWPTGKKQEAKTVPAEPASGFDLDATTSQLEQLLSGIAGAGRVRLMLTLAGSETTLYQTDSRTVTSAGSTTTQTETVFRQTGSSEKEPAAAVSGRARRLRRGGQRKRAACHHPGCLEPDRARKQ